MRSLRQRARVDPRETHEFNMAARYTGYRPAMNDTGTASNAMLP